MERSFDAIILSLTRAVAAGDYNTAKDDMQALIRAQVILEIRAEDSLNCSSHRLYFANEENKIAKSKVKSVECSHNICDKCISSVIYQDLMANGSEAEFNCPVCIADGVEKKTILFELRNPYRLGSMYLTTEQLAEVIPKDYAAHGPNKLEGDCSYKNQRIGSYTCDGSGELTILATCSCKICVKCIVAHLTSLQAGRLPRCPRANCNKIINYYDILCLNEKPLSEKFGNTYGRLSMTCPTCQDILEGDVKEQGEFTCAKGHTFNFMDAPGL
mmetsp:Transcript_23576/g.41790  ORF Transcript_23576/g.41790 Transcript_23576/m.41790 type:complete len:272 (+) Transcript_23576:1432-2247(+)